MCVVHSAESCRTRLSKQSFDIILLDYHLPPENGLTVIKDLTENKVTIAPIVVVTGHGHVGIAVEAMKAGAFDYVIKSGTNYPGILPNVIKRVLEKHKILMDKTRMEDEILLRNRELQVLNSISQVLNRSLILNEILPGAIDTISESMQLETSAIYKFDEEKNLLVRMVGAGMLKDLDELGELPSETEELNELFAEGNSRVLLSNGTSTSEWSAPLFAAGMKTCIAVLLTHNRRLNGLFLGASKEKNYFSERRVNLFSSICNQISIAIENANLYIQTHNLKDNLVDVLDSSLDLIVTLDQDGRIRFLNQRFVRVQKQPADKVEGMYFCDFIVEHKRSEVVRNIMSTDRDRSKTYLTELLTAEGATLHCVISQTRLKGRDELLLVIKDFSPIIRLQNQVMQSDKLSALGQMIAGAAHELNNPIAGISGYAQLLLEEGLEESTMQDVKVILKEARRCQEIVRNLLAFARKRDPKHQPIDLNEMLRAIVEVQGYQLRLCDIKIETDLSPELPAISADYQQVQQVVLHLIHNAQDALADQRNLPKVLRIKTAVTSECVQIVVADNGIGIPPEIHNSIFEPFFTTKDVGEGKGLGLSMCHGVIEAHRGKLSVHSKPGMGSQFTIELPIKDKFKGVKPREIVWGRYPSFET